MQASGGQKEEKKKGKTGVKRQSSVEEIKKKKGNPFRVAGHKGKQMQASFLSMTRDQYFDKHVKNQTKGPPPAYYRTNYASLDQ